ncbi:MAG: AmmeMemoRadiSam system protein B [Methanobrevibacter sp.]|uniref:AmmeMemoRadiSam system protein B n=1 Tax=Methanobrevibacter sp. TaxID=66852 RepID=UPI0026DFC918|nr:AmmeMemoRadiSam system protein B [Methanobrevibacter sp.]MDO5848748.1 AmmeMemoRadiSam system protein B [Methanobrevibacter sp.]
MIRKPAVSGTFYSDDEDELKQSIEDCFLSPFGVGKLPENVEKFEGDNYPINVMVPHAGFIYSGPIASYGYYEIAKHGIPDVFIILSPNHTGFGREISVFNEGEWNTPLGNVSVDKEFADTIISFSDIASADFEAHVREHSIEVQLPFLQFFSNDFKIVPITMGTQTLVTASDLATAIVSAAEKLGKSYCVIASTDLSHFNTQERANKVDGFVLEDIGEMNEFKLLEEIIQYNITMCGYGPVMSDIIISKLTGKEHCEILAYGTSGDVTGDFSQVVGYASAIFK